MNGKTGERGQYTTHNLPRDSPLPFEGRVRVTAITLRNFVGAVCNRTVWFERRRAVTNRTYDLPRFLT